MSALSPTSLLSRVGVFHALPKAMARLGGAAHMLRVSLEKTPAPVAPTPAVVVTSEGAAKLLRYDAVHTAPHKDPILLCPSLINRLYVLDLKTGVSLIEVLTHAGHCVYGLDWGEPGDDERGLTFEGHAHRLARLLAIACGDAGVPRMHVLGHCLGGTLATALAATDDTHMATLINLTAPLAFHDGGMLSAWSRAPFLDPAAITAVVGHVPPWLTQPAFQILKPMGQPSKVLRLFQSLDNAKFLDFFRCLETWINDNVSIPDGFFVDLINELYRKNGLVNGTLRFEGGFVQLANVKIPVFAIAAEEDHIVPHASATAPLALLGSDVTKSEVLPGGHIGVVVGSLARRRLWPAMLAWMEEHPIARAHPHIHARQP